MHETIPRFTASRFLCARPDHRHDWAGFKDDVKEAGRATKRAAKKTGHAVKEGTEDAAEATGHAARKTGRKAKRGTKKVVHGAASETEEGAAKVKEKTRPQ